MKTKTTRKLIGLLLAVTVLAAMVIVIGISASAATVPASGYALDESTNTYTVYNASGLLAWRDAANNAAVHNASASEESKLPVPNLTLAANIILPQVTQGQSNWVPVGTSTTSGEYPYSGTVDGAGYTVYNMSISQNATYHGFIATLSGTVKNLNFANVYISGSATVGTVAAKLDTTGMIENCHVLSGELHGSYYVGGITGYSFGTIAACSNGAHINAEGYLSGDHHHSFIGGIAGTQQAFTADVTIIACYNYGQISGHGGAAGGITGYAISAGTNKAQIINSYNLGPVEISTENHTNYHGFAAILGTSPSGDSSVIVDSYYFLPTFTPTTGYVAASTGVGSCDEASVAPDENKQFAKIDGTTVTWDDVLASMNASLDTLGYTWRYYANQASDSAARPLVICTAEHPDWSHGVCGTCSFACDHANCTPIYQDLGNGTHVEIYDVCGGQYGMPRPHSTDAINDKAATCTSPAYCSYCKSEYGATNPDNHNMADATCTAPKTCELCGETEGTALGHSWKAADCVTPKTCETCDTTEGAALGHSWKAADCVTPKTCTVCAVTEGAALGHKYDNNCDADCNVCKQTRSPAAHVDADEDYVCDECGAELPKEGLPTGAVVGIVLGSVAVAGGLGALLAFLLLKKKKDDDGDQEEQK